MSVALATLLILVVPLMVILQLVYWCCGYGPVLYRQRRVGRDGRAFIINKFATMIKGADQLGDHWTKAEDERVTPIGRGMRRWCIDELPQCLNVLMRQMSLVGPRPLAVAHDQKCEMAAAERGLKWLERRSALPGVADCAKPERDRLPRSDDPLLRLDLLPVELAYIASRTWLNNMRLAWRIVRALRCGHDCGK